jgi:flagella synthesis protein FlgN
MRWKRGACSASSWCAPCSARKPRDNLFASLAAPQRARTQAEWEQLTRLVSECKEATGRNGYLMAEQYSTMQRVLHGDDQTYAPR